MSSLVNRLNVDGISSCFSLLGLTGSFYVIQKCSGILGRRQDGSTCMMIYTLPKTQLSVSVYAAVSRRKMQSIP